MSVATRSIVSILVLLFALPHPLYADGDGIEAIRLAEEKAAAEAQTVSEEESRAEADQKTFEEIFGPDPSGEETGKEPDFRTILRRGVRRRVNSKKTVVVVPKVQFGVLFTGPSTYHEGEDSPITPASTSKVFTAALALKELGGDFTYDTRLTWLTGKSTDEAAYLTVVGAGDPSLTTGDLPKVTDEYVAGLVASGVKKVYGTLRFSATDPRWKIRSVPAGWRRKDLATPAGFIPDELGTLSEAGIRAALAAKIAAKGIQWIKTEPTFPEKAGIPRSTSHFSAPLRELIQPFILHSINYKGEAFLRKVGELKGASAASDLHAAGIVLLREFVSRLIGPTVGYKGVILNDGSGLSRESRVTAKAMVAFLDALKTEPFFEDFFAALPTAGRTGTLGRRMAGTSADGRVHAKTGTLEGNYQLAGYLVEATKAGNDYHPFTIFTETDAASAGYCRSVEDAALSNLAAWMLKK